MSEQNEKSSFTQRIVEVFLRGDVALLLDADLADRSAESP
jgi:hypothetical protein